MVTKRFRKVPKGEGADQIIEIRIHGGLPPDAPGAAEAVVLERRFHTPQGQRVRVRGGLPDVQFDDNGKQIKPNTDDVGASPDTPTSKEQP